MNEMRKVKDIYDKLAFILSSQQKKYAILILIMSGLAAVLEMLGVSIIIPIMDVLLDTDVLMNKSYIQPFVKALHLNSNIKVVWFVCILAMLVYVFKNLYFILFSWVSLKYSYKVNRELSSRILRAYMRQGYIFFVNNNSARLLQGIGADVSSIYNILNDIFNLITKILTIACIGLFILVRSQDMALVLIALAGICLLVIQLIFRKSMRVNGKKKRELSWQCTKTSIEAIQGNKEILVMNKQDYFVDNYEKMLAKANRTAVKVDIGTRAPAYIIEMICIVGLLFCLAIQMGRSVNINEIVGQLSAIAVSAFRILPALGGISSGINAITMNTTQLSEAYNTLKEVKQLEKLDAEKEIEISRYNNIGFEREIVIRNLAFRYPNAEENVIENVSFKIQKGQSIGLIGPSGAGKTTLADIILTLLKPTNGKILMDGIDIEELGSEWSRIIGYVPQMVYIVDDTIKNNIAFGEKTENISEGRIWEVLKMAQLDNFVRKLPEGLNTIVGEHGIRFSGGQRQRLAIARALYRNPEILILDEATAALDNETESAVMESIEALQGYKTLIIVAHRLTTVSRCDMIYEIKDKKATVRSKTEIYGA